MVMQGAVFITDFHREAYSGERQPSALLSDTTPLRLAQIYRWLKKILWLTITETGQNKIPRAAARSGIS
ncbi:hypothetical protein [Erwinia psidii]|uniref:Uncharacterized protein n=1 Tax=Erwinia psidii TaxID=69224 RepID=A0A3N6S3S0_9GAMM|nr:hypothetical protein [Erwinia psidii]MCX8957667.1 hypothetical protein [Erwinia psidii]MCX8964033.1 hypothetical protein [Erwinia psidii]RQM39517.1 hypothetical protein EB241_03560 [Erwinia psidii]